MCVHRGGGGSRCRRGGGLIGGRGSLDRLDGLIRDQKFSK